MKTSKEEFYTLAKDFCAYLESTVITRDKLDDVMTYLMKLYVKGISLPNVEPDDTEICRREHNSNFSWLQIDCESCYWQMFDPFVSEDPVGGNLLDDLSDIYEDIMDGIYEYENGRHNNAVWTWTFGLYEHWGRHLVHALSALHGLRKM